MNQVEHVPQSLSLALYLSVNLFVCLRVFLCLSGYFSFFISQYLSFFFPQYRSVYLYPSMYFCLFFSLSLTNSNLSLSLFPSFTLPLQFCSPIPFLFFLHSSLSFHLFHSHLISLSEKRKCDQEEKEEEGEGEYAY